MTSSSIDRVYYAYESGGQIIVDGDNFSTVAGGSSVSSGGNILAATPSTGPYFKPRIACPNPNSSGVAASDWTVVFSNLDNSNYYKIIGYTNDNNTGLNGPYFYNDGTYSSFDTDGAINYEPVVTYVSPTGNNPEIIVGWNFDNSGPLTILTTAADFPIVYHCTQDGVPSSGNFWEVPTTLSGSDVINYLSLSGRNANDAVYCSFHHFTNTDVYYKTVTSITSATSLKLSTTKMPPVETEKLKANIFDINGRLVNCFEGTYFTIQNNVKNFVENNGNSLYLIEIFSKNRGYYSKSKFINIRLN